LADWAPQRLAEIWYGDDVSAANSICCLLPPLGLRNRLELFLCLISRLELLLLLVSKLELLHLSGVQT
jgi:hypothetical protein